MRITWLRELFHAAKPHPHEPHVPKNTNCCLPNINQRGIPTHECFNCGSTLFTVQAWFEDYDIAGWLMNAHCAICDSPLTAPCPVDDPNNI